MNEKMKLPKGWEVKKLGDVCDLQNGFAFKSADYIDSSDTLIFRMSQIRPGGDLDLNHNSKYLPNDFVQKYSSYLLKDGDVVIAMTDMATETKILGLPTYFKSDGRYFLLNQRVGKLFNFDKSQIDVKYLRYILSAPNTIKYYKSFGKGALQINLGKSDILNAEIPIPPLSEQTAIVTKIEELLSDLENGKQQLLTAQTQLKVYRQSLLKWAFENEKLKTTILKDVTEKIQIGPFGTQLHREDYIENGIPLINPTHIKDGFIVSDSSYSILESKRDSLPNYILREGDVIMGRRGEMGRCGLVTKKEVGWFCGTGSLYFRPNNQLLNPVFLYYYLCSKPVRKYLEENAGGTTMANLNLKIVNYIPISLPSLAEQQRIVEELESKLTICDKIEETISQSLLQAETLRQSILKKAFEGRLV
ncbi:MAG: restriction endonuclease subunit S [Arcicella sp.]|jgi:type I restriction enzyme S subunit|nr:restriction endonuclease subunit S [Arcicella sp.]